MRTIAEMLILILLTPVLGNCGKKVAGTTQQPDTIGANPNLADPSIYFEKGIYYLYGTGGGNKDDGFKVFTSADKINWIDRGYALLKGAAYGESGFWAPQVFKHNGKYYMAYTANEHIAIATGTSPMGPFTQEVKQPVDATIKTIDPYVFFDEASGKMLLYHVRLINGNNIYVAELNQDLSAIKNNTLAPCINATEPWEDTQKVPWKVTEGPTVLKHKDTYYLIYSANDFRNPDYAVGYATAASPAGPWTKYSGNPIISKEVIKENGPGHGDVVMDGSGILYYVLHTHYAATAVQPRLTAIIKIAFEAVDEGPDKIVVYPDSFRYLKKEK